MNSLFDGRLAKRVSQSWLVVWTKVLPSDAQLLLNPVRVAGQIFSHLGPCSYRLLDL